MRYSTPESDKSRIQDMRAAVFVDYENLFGHIYSRIGSRGRPDELINELLDELGRYLIEEVRTQTALINAYADFSEMHGSGQYVQRALYLRGIEPRFVPGALQRNASEIQLCVDAIEVLHNRSDIRTFVIVTGDRPYLPLVQQFKRYGCQALIATLAPPPSTDALPHVEDDVFLDAFNLLSDSSRRALASSSSTSSNSHSQQRPTYQKGRTEPVDYISIEKPGTLRALEIIEEHFGQYEEVYLTPLLRKLSELLDEDLYDPKTIISELEEVGAVWLEKRRGFPYDYTVLLIDADHPDVAAIQKEAYARHEPADGAPTYEDDEADDYYVDDYDDDYDDEEDYIDEESFTNGSSYDAGDDYDEEDYVDAEEDDR